MCTDVDIIVDTGNNDACMTGAAHRTDLRHLRTMAHTIDDSFEPLDRQLSHFAALLEASMHIVDPSIVGSIVDAPLNSLACASDMARTHNEIAVVRRRFEDARRALERAVAEIAAARQILVEASDQLAVAIIDDKQRLVSSALDANARPTASAPIDVDASSPTHTRSTPTDECYLCTEPLQPPLMWIDGCSCTQPTVACRRCFDYLVYTSTDGSRRSDFRCSMCRDEVDLNSLRTLDVPGIEHSPASTP